MAQEKLPPTGKRTVTIRGKPVTFSARQLKSGEIAYYRAGRRVHTPYQIRVARGVLMGQSVTEARGHPFGKYSGKLLTRRDISEQEEFHLGAWAEPPRNDARGREKATYYAKVAVKSESMNKIGSPTGTDAVCVPATLQLFDPDTNTQTGFTYRDLASRFERIILFTLGKKKLELCSGNLSQDLINVWRHSRR